MDITSAQAKKIAAEILASGGEGIQPKLKQKMDLPTGKRLDVYEISSLQIATFVAIPIPKSDDVTLPLHESSREHQLITSLQTLEIPFDASGQNGYGLTQMKAGFGSTSSAMMALYVAGDEQMQKLAEAGIKWPGRDTMFPEIAQQQAKGSWTAKEEGRGGGGRSNTP